jgi:pimeloyl-ACP methyl ester carboxylesterase
MILAPSMGGAMVAMHFGVRFPDLTQRLVLIAPAFAERFPLFFHLMTVPGLGEFLLRPPRSVRAKDKALRMISYEKIKYEPPCIEQYYKVPALSGLSPSAAQLYTRRHQYVRPTRKEKRFHRWFQKRLPGMPAPNLLIWGKSDRIAPSRHATALRA